MEHYFATPERPASRDLQHLPHILSRNIGEQWPFHPLELMSPR
jgi:hypothetical protein